MTSKRSRTAWLVSTFALLVLAGGARSGSAAVAEHTQTFVLQPGWNSVFLEVRPEDNSAEAVFGGLPLASAWTWNPAAPKVEFIENPTEQLTPNPQWLGYFPWPRPESILTNLFAVQANRAYLLKIDGAVPVTWSVTGVPEVQNLRWVPDSFNLVGFPVDPLQQPNFGQYLAPSAAHVGQPIYRLVGGEWQEVTNPFATQIRSGEAYWVYCQGASDYTGPVSIEVDLGKGMEFGATSSQQRLRIRNLGSSPASISLRKVDGSAPLPLAFFQFDADTGEISWPTLPQQLSLATVAGEELLLDFAPKRAQFSSPDVGSILEIRDGFGFLRRLAVSARTAFAPPSFLAARGDRGGRLAQFDTNSTNALAGLWVGDVRVRKVSQAQTGSLITTPVGQEYIFRIMMHVDGSGVVRLLDEVVQLWKEGTRIPDPENPGLFLVDEPGRYVLITDESLIPNFEGAILRDGEPVGYRMSTVGYDFEPQFLVMSGSFATSGTLTASLTLDSESPTNPFRHKYHPDHNNRNELYTVFLEEAYPVTRQMTLAFTSEDPFGRDLPSYGESVIGGHFSESITGLHRNDIVVDGFFTLARISGSPVLNE
jgi:hypothetical protein